MVAAGGAKPFALERRERKLCLRGNLQLASAPQLWRDLHRDTAHTEGDLDIDLSGVENLDGAAVALLVDLRARLIERGVRSRFVGASAHVAELVALYQGYQPPKKPRVRRRFGFVEHIVEDARAASQAARGMVEFIGATTLEAIRSLVWPIRGERRSVLPLIVRAGTDAIPLVLLLNFLLGLVIAYDTSEQLVRYGAELYIADVVGVAVTRELSPVMTSIIVLGRSAAAYAAELGSMKVSEELDALRTMGIVPVRQLVLPRVIALCVVTPLLTLLGDVSGVVGGALIAVLRLDLMARAYLTELQSVVVMGDVLGGLVKASVAGIAVAVIGAQQGFAASGGPAGVGVRTTATVVKGLVALILIDAFFALFLGAIRS